MHFDLIIKMYVKSFVAFIDSEIEFELSVNRNFIFVVKIIDLIEYILYFNFELENLIAEQISYTQIRIFAIF